MSTRYGRLVALGLVVAIAGCGTADVPSSSSQPAGTDTPSPTTSGGTATAQNIYDVPNFSPLEPGTYHIDPDKDSSTALRVLYTIPGEGWGQWIGALKGEEGENRAVGVSIASVTNLVADGCSDHAAAQPPVGPTVDDLAAALATLAPFHLKEPPSEVTLAGYRGKYVALTLPDVPHELRDGNMYFTECTNGEIWSWKAPNLSDAFYGYSPGLVEEFWILDVEGSRVMIQAMWFAESPPEDIAEMRAILESIQIEP